MNCWQCKGKMVLHAGGVRLPDGQWVEPCWTCTPCKVAAPLQKAADATPGEIIRAQVETLEEFLSGRKA